MLDGLRLVIEKMDELEKKQEEISQAFDALRLVRMEERTKDESNPKLKLQRDVINRLKKEQGVIFDELKPLRKDADKAIDKKAWMTITERSVIRLSP